MRIAYLIPGLGKGGAERVVIDLACAMASDGHQVTVVTRERVPPEVREELVGVELCSVAPDASASSSYPALLRWTWAHRQWLASLDLLHCHLTFGAVGGSLARHVTRSTGSHKCAVVETYHAVGAPIPSLLRAFHAWLLQGRDAVAFMAEDPFWTAYREGHSGLLTRLIPNGVRLGAPMPDHEAVKRFRSRCGLPDDALVVGTVGRLVPERRPAQLLDAFAAVASAGGERVHFLLAGEGPEQAALQARAAALGIADRVHFPGLVADPRAAFANIDIYVTLNVGPITGVAALEAAGFGLPVVAIQAVADRGENDSDWIWSTPSSARLAQRINGLIADPAERRTLAARQKNHVATHFSAATMIDSYRRLYREALERRSFGAPVPSSAP